MYIAGADGRDQYPRPGLLQNPVVGTDLFGAWALHYVIMLKPRCSNLIHSLEEIYKLFCLFIKERVQAC
jgi:hypothetical protein